MLENAIFADLFIANQETIAGLNKIRQRSLVLILVIAMALFAFVIGDLFKNSDALSGGNQDVIATINGKNINRTDL